MKTKYTLIWAIFIAYFCSFLHAEIPGVIKRFRVPEVYFDIPQQVLDLTDPAKLNLPPQLTEPNEITYESMKQEIREKLLYRSGFSVFNSSGGELLIVIGGKPYYNVRDGKNVGLVIMPKNTDIPMERPMEYNLFEKYGDPLVIGAFKLGKDHAITSGSVRVIRFADLMDSSGNMRNLRMIIDKASISPLDKIRVVHDKPVYNDFKMSVVLPLKPGVAPLVINRHAPNLGPVVPMDPFKVTTMKDWAKLKPIADSSGKVSGAQVESVRENTPYATAGLKAGMIIKGVKVMNAPDDGDVITSGWTKGDIVFSVVDGTGVRGTIVVPMVELRKAVRLKPAGDVVSVMQ